MGYAYLFALIVGLGILSAQALLGAKDTDADGDGHPDHHTGKEHLAEGAGEGSWAHDALAMFMSVRFWVFAAMAFGLSGSLLHYATGVNAIATAITATVLGLVSGCAAALTFRYLSRTSSAHAANSGLAAVGRIGRVIVPCPANGVGKVRIEIGGETVDLMARSGGLRIERGDSVLIEEVEGEIAQVCRAPEELR
jgi:hypothetical protein